MDAKTVLIVQTALWAIVVPPLLIVWILSFHFAPRSKDSARVAFSYMKAVFPVVILCLCLYIAGNISGIVEYGTEADTDTYNLLTALQLRVFSVGDLFLGIGNALTIVCLVELGNGFLFRIEPLRTRAQIMLRYLAIAFASLVIVLAIAQLGVFNTQYTPYINHQDSAFWNSTSGNWIFTVPLDQASYNKGINTAIDLSVSGDVFTLAAAVPTVGFALYVLHRCRTAAIPLLNSAVLFLVATLLNLLRASFAIAEDALWVIPNATWPGYSYILLPLLNAWPWFVMLVLVYVAGKSDGLWSTQQSWAGQGVPLEPLGKLELPGEGVQRGGWQQPPQGGWGQGLAGWQQRPPVGWQGQPLLPELQGSQRPPREAPPSQPELQGWQPPPQDRQPLPQCWQQSHPPIPAYSPPPGELAKPP